MESIDIIEDNIVTFGNGKVLKELLSDQTRRQSLRTQVGHEEDYAYIIWATDDYASNGEGYSFEQEIRPELITGEHRALIMPRVLKDKLQQVQRSKEKAEVFTPSWVCNAQNNLVDEAWFGRKDVFNSEYTNEDGSHGWVPSEYISFEGTNKTWEDYLRDTRMEITCGEAPYLVSRYDTTTGEVIPLKKRVGLLDRKMRVINENVDSIEDWKKWAKIALHNIYGFEWQGDSLLLAREAVLYSILDYYEDFQIRLGQKPKAMATSTMISFANIISWNLWQMDGIKYVIPGTCGEKEVVIEEPATLFEEAKIIRKVCPCEGCATGDNTKHNGTYSLIRNWGVWDNDHKDKNGLTGKERCDIRFVDLVDK